MKLDDSLYESIEGKEITDLGVRVKFAQAYTDLSGGKRLKTPFKFVFVRLPSGKIKASVVTEKFKPIKTEEFLESTGLKKLSSWYRDEEDMLSVKGELNGIDVFVENSYTGTSALKVTIGKYYPIVKLTRVIHYGDDSVDLNVEQLKKEVETFSAFLESKIDLKGLKDALKDVVKFDKREEKEVPVGLHLYEKLKDVLVKNKVIEDAKTADAASVTVLDVIKAINDLYKERRKGDGLTKAVRKKLLDTLEDHYNAWKDLIKQNPAIAKNLKIRP